MASYLLGAAGITGCVIGISKTFGLELPARVSCWFCPHKQTVKFSRRNAWHCDACGQYNGFNKDGDYNQTVPGQHSDIPVRTDHVYTAEVAKSKPLQTSESALCDTCNRNQEMKIFQLRNFTPSNPKKEDQELEEYQNHLERTYRLCRPCEAKVRQVLGEQDSKLKQKFLAWKLSLFRKSPLISSQDLIGHSEYYLSALSKILLISLALVIWIASLQETSYAHVPQDIVEMIRRTSLFPLPENFGYFELVTVSVPLALAVWYCQSPNSSISSNWRHLVSILFWLALFGQRILEMTMFKFELASLTLMFSILAAWPLSSTETSYKNEKIKKKRNLRKKLYENLNIKLNDDIIEENEEDEIHLSNENIETPISTPSLPETAENSPKTASNPNDFYLPNHEIYQNSNQQCDISTLQIDALTKQKGLPEVSGNLRPESPFSLKNYQSGHDESINFGEMSSFIKPAKFVYNERNRVAQSSWVAGGYWQNSKQNIGQNETLSRSSSQSSGIGSLTSAAGLHQNLFASHAQAGPFNVSSLPNSRVNSTCGNGNANLHEKFSIFSEPAYKLPANHLNSTLNSTILARNPQFQSSRSQNGVDHDHDQDSLNSSFGRMSQEAFDKLRPRANSSPKPSENKVEEKEEISFLEKKITINISLYSLFLFLSVGFNVSLSAYLVSKYVWH